MIDYHVDRPGVEALRGVKLTGTNCSIGLIYLKPMRGDEHVARQFSCRLYVARVLPLAISAV